MKEKPTEWHERLHKRKERKVCMSPNPNLTLKVISEDSNIQSDYKSPNVNRKKKLSFKNDLKVESQLAYLVPRKKNSFIADNNTSFMF